MGRGLYYMLLKFILMEGRGKGNFWRKFFSGGFLVLNRLF